MICGLRMRPLADADPQNFYNPRTDVVDIPYVFLSRRCRRRLGRMLSGQSTDQTMHMLVCWKARRRPVANRLDIAISPSRYEP